MSPLQEATDELRGLFDELDQARLELGALTDGMRDHLDRLGATARQISELQRRLEAARSRTYKTSR